MLSETNLIGISLLIAFLVLLRLTVPFVLKFLDSYKLQILSNLDEIKSLIEQSEEELEKSKEEYQSLEADRIKLINNATKGANLKLEEYKASEKLNRKDKISRAEFIANSREKTAKENIRLQGTEVAFCIAKKALLEKYKNDSLKFDINLVIAELQKEVGK